MSALSVAVQDARALTRLSQADLTAAVEKEGYKLAASGVSSIRYDFLSTVKVLQAKGLLKKPLLN